VESYDDGYEAVRAIEDLKRAKLKTPGGNRGRPFKVLEHNEDELTLRTSGGGKVRLRAETFDTALRILRDLGAVTDGGWVLMKDETLDMVLRGENRDKACTSYVFPLLEAAGKVEIERGRPTRLRLAPRVIEG